MPVAALSPPRNANRATPASSAPPEVESLDLDALAARTAESDFVLTERITAQPPYVLNGADWIDPALTQHVAALADPVTGLAVDTRPAPRPWPAVA